MTGRAELTLATWNVNQWPIPLRAPRDRRRLESVVAAIRGFDVVCLQECWSRAARGIRRVFPASFAGHTRSAWGFGSGLLTLSRHPVVSGCHARFERAVAPDALAAKGMTLATVDIPGFGPLCVVNTHLQAWRGREVRRVQVEQLGRFVAARATGSATALVGDFNARRGSPEIGHLHDVLGCRDALDERPITLPGGTVRFSGDERRIDHMLLITCPDRVQVVETGIVREPAGEPASDHAGLWMRLRLSR